jgi:CRISPR-associated protein Csx17
MVEATRHDLELPGCTPEPLMAYLKALGILRLVSEQKDSTARGWWKNDFFRLRSRLDRDALVEFLLEEYKPTPIVVPWSGGDFFSVDWQVQPSKFSKTPTASKVIEAILTTQTDRFEPYRQGLLACKAALDRCAINTKEEMERQKWSFIQELRSSCDESLLIEWMDAAAVGTVERFAALLGSGGGSDGNTHFSDNFMQNLWDVLQDFDGQRESRRGQSNHPTIVISRELLHDALFKVGTNRLIVKRTSSLYDSGAVGGPNATQGMERESLSNPWNVILALEGTIGFAGAASRRLAASAASDGAFPFQIAASVTVQNGLAGKERAGTEIWIPLWTRPARSDEVLDLLREGRAQCGPRPARNGVDMARAVASLGVDRGIGAFGRYAILKGRVGGESYNTAASLGRVYVAERAGVDLLREIDPGLDRFRRAAANKDAPPRFGSAVRRIDSAIFEFCKYGGASFFQRIAMALGAAERELRDVKRFREDKKLRPLAELSAEWIKAADDGSPEFAVARALADVHDPEGKIGPLRANLEPVDWKKRCSAWAEKDRSVVWNAADPVTNLANVLERRVMDGSRAGCERLPNASRSPVPLNCIAAFLHGELDDRRIADLIWGLMLIRDGGTMGSVTVGTNRLYLPRAYALLKLLFLPRLLVFERAADGKFFARLSNGSGGVVISPEPTVLHLLRSGQLGEACAVAMRRLRASGLNPLPGPIRGRRVRDGDWRELDDFGGDGSRLQRLTAALLIPITDLTLDWIFHLVIHGDEQDERTTLMVATHRKGGTQS